MKNGEYYFNRHVLMEVNIASPFDRCSAPVFRRGGVGKRKGSCTAAAERAGAAAVGEVGTGGE